MKGVEKLLSVIIVSFNTRDALRECLMKVREYGGATDLEVFVVDNASADGSPRMVEQEFPEVVVIESAVNRGFAGANNLALKQASGRFFLLLNSDAYLAEGVLGSTIGYMEDHPECGVLGVKLVGEDGRMQPSARSLPSPWFKFLVMSGIAARFPHSAVLGGPDYSWWDHGSVKEVGWVPGAYFLIRREVTERIGYLDERYFLYFEEIDFCLHTQKAGWKVVFYPYARVIHTGGQSSTAAGRFVTTSGRQLLHLRIRSEFRYYRKNYGMVKVLESAGVEIFWKSLVWLKNFVLRSRGSDLKRREAALTLTLITNTLIRDRFGARSAPGP